MDEGSIINIMIAWFGVSAIGIAGLWSGMDGIKTKMSDIQKDVAVIKAQLNIIEGEP